MTIVALIRRFRASLVGSLYQRLQAHLSAALSCLEVLPPYSALVIARGVFGKLSYQSSMPALFALREQTEGCAHDRLSNARLGGRTALPAMACW